MKERKCRYCGVELKDKANIRCYKCDEIWQAGYAEGDKNLRQEVGVMFRKILQWGITQ